MGGLSLAMKFGSLIAGVGILLLLLKKIKVLKKYGIISLLYTLLYSILLSSATFVFLGLFQSDLANLVAGQFLVVCIGVVYVSTYKKTLPWLDEQNLTIWLVFAICILLFAHCLSNLVFTFILDSYFQILWYISLLWFLIPIILLHTINAAVIIPPKHYKAWFYPVNRIINDPSDAEMANPVVISFVFEKNETSKELTTFRAKAPLAMSFDRLFYFFINDYNYRNSESGISYINNNNEPCGWIFYKVKSKFFNIQTVIDPDATISQNNIKENNVLICKRIKIQSHETIESEG